MCEATVAAMVVTSIAGAVKAGTDIAAGYVEKGAIRQQADAQIQETQYAEDIAKKNETLAKMQRADVLQQGSTEAGRARTAGRTAAENAKAQVGASGISLTEGSVPNLFSVSRVNADLDAQAIKASAARGAWGFQNEAEQLSEQQKQLRQRAQYIRQAGALGGLGVDLRTAGSVTSTAGQTVGSLYSMGGK